VIKYNIGKNKWGYPSMGIDEKYWMLHEFGSIRGSYLNEVIQEMENVRDGKRESYSFGFEATGVDVYKVGDKPYSGKTFINYDYGEREMEVPFEDIYNLMKDWREYLNKWEEETGRKKL
jgi:hypothetical protein